MNPKTLMKRWPIGETDKLVILWLSPHLLETRQLGCLLAPSLYQARQQSWPNTTLEKM